MLFDRQFDDDGTRTPLSEHDLFGEEELVPEQPLQRRRSFVLRSGAAARIDPRSERCRRILARRHVSGAIGLEIALSALELNLEGVEPPAIARK